ncbi:MAG: hypothetical protein FWE49_04550 [Synergistaceae bacterium]|nr:hypothetical protein [Synergistaceae bacterium]
MSRSKLLLRKIIGDKLFSGLQYIKRRFINEPEYIKKAIGERYSDREYVARLRTDIQSCKKDFGADISDYFTLGFEQKNSEERKKYITEESRFRYYEVLNKDEDIEIFHDKYRTYEIFKPFYLREVVLINDESDRDKYYDFITKHPDFVVKTCRGASGTGVSVVNVEKGKEDSAFRKLAQKMPLILEERIVQKDTMAALHPESINTCRITTVLLNDGCHILNPAVRIGRGSGIIDNAGAGGLFAPVDVESGKILQDAFDIYGLRYSKHPESNIVFSSFIVPEWEEALALAEKLCRVIPTTRYTGWDLALSDKGWMMVEGNCWAQLKMIQANGGVKEKMDDLCRSAILVEELST